MTDDSKCVCQMVFTNVCLQHLSHAIESFRRMISGV